jgi:hypothetical protein
MNIKRLENNFEIDFLILGINSHIKSYKLCWEINNKLHTRFVKNKNHLNPNNPKLTFERFTHIDEGTESQYNILSNRSPSGYLEESNKSVNYFMVVQGGIYSKKKIIESLNQIEDVLLVFELNLSNIKSITPFILND